MFMHRTTYVMKMQKWKAYNYSIRKAEVTAEIVDTISTECGTIER